MNRHVRASVKPMGSARIKNESSKMKLGGYISTGPRGMKILGPDRKPIKRRDTSIPTEYEVSWYVLGNEDTQFKSFKTEKEAEKFLDEIKEREDTDFEAGYPEVRPWYTDEDGELVPYMP